METKLRGNIDFDAIVQLMVERNNSKLTIVDLQIDNGNDIMEISEGTIVNVTEKMLEVSTRGTGKQKIPLEMVSVLEII